jgi:hypothetical protein
MPGTDWRDADHDVGVEGLMVSFYLLSSFIYGLLY